MSGAAICWRCNLLKSFSRSRAEAELSALIETVKEAWFAGLLQKSFLEGLPEDEVAGSFVIRVFTDSASAKAIPSMEGLLDLGFRV